MWMDVDAIHAVSYQEPYMLRNSLLTVDEDKFLFHVAAIFEHEEHGKLSNNIRFACGMEHFMADKVHKSLRKDILI